MRSSVITIALYVFAEAAMAQCAAQAPTANAVRPSGELIKTAAADTREGQAAFRSTPATAPAQEKRPHRTGTAMLFAALALMSGIALRRYTAPKQ